jgi:hypothetical protein
MQYIIQFFALIIWIAGIVIAKGFWSTFFGIFFPPWAWYLVIEKLLRHFGVL